MSNKPVVGTILYTKESKQSKEKAAASLQDKDPESTEEFNRIVAANTVTGGAKPNVHTTGDDRRTGGGSD